MRVLLFTVLAALSTVTSTASATMEQRWFAIIGPSARSVPNRAAFMALVHDGGCFSHDWVAYPSDHVVVYRCNL